MGTGNTRGLPSWLATTRSSEDVTASSAGPRKGCSAGPQTRRHAEGPASVARSTEASCTGAASRDDGTPASRGDDGADATVTELAWPAPSRPAASFLSGVPSRRLHAARNATRKPSGRGTECTRPIYTDRSGWISRGPPHAYDARQVIEIAAHTMWYSVCRFAIRADKPATIRQTRSRSFTRDVAPSQQAAAACARSQPRSCHLCRPSSAACPSHAGPPKGRGDGPLRSQGRAA